jgi:phosphoserine phosphatase
MLGSLNRKIGLVIFDLDGTLTPVDSLWKYLHEEFGTWDRGKIAAEKYRQGKISYEEWAQTDARYWAGAELSRIEKALHHIPYRKGAQQVFRALRERNVKTAIISAGLSLLADKAAKDLCADLVFSNELETNDNRLTGEIRVKVAVNEKRQIVEQIAKQLGVPLNEVALVGDRAFDLSQPECLKIAFKPKDNIARREADIVVEDDDLSRIIHYLI